MTLRCFDVWDYANTESFVADILNNSYDRIIIFAHREIEVLPLRRYPEIRNLPIETITGAGEYINEIPYNVTHTWKEWFLMQSLSHWCANKYLPSDYTKHQKKYHFISMNDRGHRHRCYMVDQLAKYNLIETNPVTWSNNYYSPEFKFDWQFFNPRKITLDGPEGYEKHRAWFILPEQYNQSCFQLISESAMDATFITEKTTGALFNFMPFITYGSKHFYKQLRTLGIVDYNELFDYSFDEIDDDNVRADMIVDNVNRLAQMPLHELELLVDSIKDKVIYNYHRAIEVARSYHTWHPLALETVDRYKTTGEILNDSIVGVYNTLNIYYK